MHVYVHSHRVYTEVCYRGSIKGNWSHWQQCKWKWNEWLIGGRNTRYGNLKYYPIIIIWVIIIYHFMYYNFLLWIAYIPFNCFVHSSLPMIIIIFFTSFIFFLFGLIAIYLPLYYSSFDEVVIIYIYTLFNVCMMNGGKSYWLSFFHANDGLHAS